MLKKWIFLISISFILTSFSPTTKANSGDFSGGVAIGTGYAGVNTAPANGLIVQGNVGIGTTSPAENIDIFGTSFVYGRIATTTTGSVNEAALFLQRGDQANGYAQLHYSTASTNRWSLGLRGSDDNYHIYDETVGVDRFIINTSGNIGIGTTSPTNTLHVYTTTNTYGITIDGTANPALSVNTSGTAKAFLGVATASNAWSNGSVSGDTILRSQNNLLFNTNNGGTAAMYINTSNKVGIGTISPAQALEVNGEVQIDTFASASATTVCKNGNVLSTCSSAGRYKENIKPANFGLNEVMELRPITFKWKGRNENDFGLKAEDVEKVNPLFVTYEHGEIEGVKYPQLTAVLINAVQEQEKQIKEQQVAIDEQRLQINELKQVVAQLTHRK